MHYRGRHVGQVKSATLCGGEGLHGLIRRGSAKRAGQLFCAYAYPQAVTKKRGPQHDQEEQHLLNFGPCVGVLRVEAFT